MTTVTTAVRTLTIVLDPHGAASHTEDAFLMYRDHLLTIDARTLAHCTRDPYELASRHGTSLDQECVRVARMIS